ncbi:hypothetical protein CDEST_08446 [Colletotrichum destructivum]|uniref:Uncharacterized protein n=1 Tax=Colletotrichum destructivum TaxID=34406 RepID=A0AAX4IJK8_9PEZI|nr:hypothetical protein CDEST_08446 [Colletotrichum destructivum]
MKDNLTRPTRHNLSSSPQSTYKAGAHAPENDLSDNLEIQVLRGRPRTEVLSHCELLGQTGKCDQIQGHSRPESCMAQAQETRKLSLWPSRRAVQQANDAPIRLHNVLCPDSRKSNPNSDSPPPPRVANDEMSGV